MDGCQLFIHSFFHLSSRTMTINILNWSQQSSGRLRIEEDLEVGFRTLSLGHTAARIHVHGKRCDFLRHYSHISGSSLLP